MVQRIAEEVLTEFGKIINDKGVQKNIKLKILIYRIKY